MDEHRQGLLVSQGEDRLDPGVREAELLCARMQLDPARARGDRPCSLRVRIVVGIEPAEGHEPSLRRRGRMHHHVVGVRVAFRDVQREAHGPRLEYVERRGERGGLADHAVAVGADVRVRIDDRERRQVVEQRVEPSAQVGVVIDRCDRHATMIVRPASPARRGATLDFYARDRGSPGERRPDRVAELLDRRPLVDVDEVLVARAVIAVMKARRRKRAAG